MNCIFLCQVYVLCRDSDFICFVFAFLYSLVLNDYRSKWLHLNVDIDGIWILRRRTTICVVLNNTTLREIIIHIVFTGN